MVVDVCVYDNMIPHHHRIQPSEARSVDVNDDGGGGGIDNDGGGGG